jgi:ABC-type polar amino acid transport system ATPase subunit
VAGRVEHDSFAIASAKQYSSKLEYSARIPQGDTFIGWAVQKKSTKLAEALEAGGQQQRVAIARALAIERP